MRYKERGQRPESRLSKMFRHFDASTNLRIDALIFEAFGRDDKAQSARSLAAEHDNAIVTIYRSSYREE